MPGLQKLSLGGIGNKKSLSFIKSIAPLKARTYILGGRMNVNDLAHDSLERFEILRALGLSEISLTLNLHFGLDSLASGKYDCQVTVLALSTSKETFWRAPIVVAP